METLIYFFYQVI